MRRRTADEKARGRNSYRTWQRPADSLLELGTAVRQPAFAGTISTPASALSAHQTPSAPCIPSSAHVAFPVCDPHAPRLKPEVLKDSPAAIPPCPLTHSGIFQTAFFFFSCTHRISHPSSAFRGPAHRAIATTCFLLPCWSFSEDSLPREQAWSSRTDSRQLHPALASAVLSPTSVFGSVLGLMMLTGTSRQRLIPFPPLAASQPFPACSHSLAGLSPYPPNCPFILQLGQSL